LKAMGTEEFWQEEERRQREVQEARRRGTHTRRWALWGVWGGFLFGGIILGIPALISYNRWKREEIHRPLTAEVIGWLVIAVLLSAVAVAIVVG
jgi:hypothetical protein